MLAVTSRLDHAVERVRGDLSGSHPLSARLRALWAGAKAASDMAPADVIARKFLQLAFDAGLTAQLGRHGEQDIRHVIDWAIKGHDPFGN